MRSRLCALLGLLAVSRHHKPVSQRARRGFLGLQGDRGEPVEFRNIRIKEL